MKKFLMILFITSILSCSIETDNPIDPEMIGEWVLVQTSGQVPNSIKTGSNMPFQETYTLQQDGTFIKTRIDSGEVLKSTGTFELSEPGKEIEGPDVKLYVKFHHYSPNELIATCYSSSLTEFLFLDTGGTLIGTHQACDGFGVRYEKDEP